MFFAILGHSLALAGSLTLGSGTVVVVTDVGPGDALSKERGTLLGEVCAVGESPLVSVGDGWWRGTLLCANGGTYSASAVAVTVPGTAAQPRSVSAATIAQQVGKSIRFASGAPATAIITAPPAAGTVYPARSSDEAPADSIRRRVRAGEAVRIVGLSNEDAYYADRGSIIGKACYPTDDLSQNAEGWHGGPMRCWDGDSYYFFMVALATDPTHSSQDLMRPAPEASSASGLPDVPGTLPDGTSVVIRDVSDEDAFYSDRADFLGKDCKVTGDLHPQDDKGWFGGGLTCKKKYYYFYKVRVDRK